MKKDTYYEKGIVAGLDAALQEHTKPPDVLKPTAWPSRPWCNSILGLARRSKLPYDRHVVGYPTHRQELEQRRLAEAGIAEDDHQTIAGEDVENGTDWTTLIDFAQPRGFVIPPGNVPFLAEAA